MRGLRLLAMAMVMTSVAQAQTPARRSPAPRTPHPAPSAKPDLSSTRVVVYKSPSCGCCGQWVDYMRRSGYTVTVHDQDDVTPVKRAAGVPDEAASCHTAQIGGYVVEGHVPVEAIRRMLREKPNIVGLAVPGMVAGSPGMEMGNTHPAYNVMAIGRDGHLSVYERH
jgi:hypothetical protein